MLLCRLFLLSFLTTTTKMKKKDAALLTHTTIQVDKNEKGILSYTAIISIWGLMFMVSLIAYMKHISFKKDFLYFSYQLNFPDMEFWVYEIRFIEFNMVENCCLLLSFLYFLFWIYGIENDLNGEKKKYGGDGGRGSFVSHNLFFLFRFLCNLIIHLTTITNYIREALNKLNF